LRRGATIELDAHDLAQGLVVTTLDIRVVDENVVTLLARSSVAK